MDNRLGWVVLVSVLAFGGAARAEEVFGVCVELHADASCSFAAVSVTGDAAASACCGVAVSPFGQSTGVVAVSIFGDSEGLYGAAVSVFGDASCESGCSALTITGDAEGGLGSVSATGASSGLSACEVLAARVPELCFDPV